MKKSVRILLKNRRLTTTLALAGLVGASGCATSGAHSSSHANEGLTGAEATAAIAPVKDQRALAALKQMSDALAQAKSLRFDTASMTPFQGPNGQWLHLLKADHVEMQRPNQLRVDAGGDAFPQSFYFDGKSYSVFSKEAHLFSQTPISGTVDQMLAEASQKGGEIFSFSDVLLADPYASWTEGLEGAVYVGESLRGSEKLQHLALTAKSVHWEVWIGVKDHLPRLVYAKYVGEQRIPMVMIEFSKWRLNGKISSSTFAFKAPSGAKKALLRAPRGDEARDSTLNAETEGKAHP